MPRAFANSTRPTTGRSNRVTRRSEPASRRRSISCSRGRPSGRRGGSARRRSATSFATATRFAQDLIVTRCTRGADIARSLRFSDAVCDGIYCLDEHWDGSGRPGRLRGEQIPLFARIALIAQVVDVFQQHAGPAAAMDEVARRPGCGSTPQLVSIVRCASARIRSSGPTWLRRSWRRRSPRSLPPNEAFPVDDDFLDDIAKAFGEVIDAKSPFTAGHSGRVAELADANRSS